MTPSRRNFLQLVALGSGALTGLVMGLPIIGYLVAPLFQKPNEKWRAVGDANSFQIGKTVEVHFQDASATPWAGVVGQTAAWLRRESENEFIAFSINCMHLGCPVRWIDDAELFMCPCHGGVYYKNGNVAAGPPPKPLGRYEVRVRNGQVEVQTGPIPMA